MSRFLCGCCSGRFAPGTTRCGFHPLTGHKCKGFTGFGGTARPADAMGIGVFCLRHIIINDMRDVCHINASSGDIGGNHDFLPAVTDGADPQWKQVIHDSNIKVSYALSPQAKGKIERPYGWIQDIVVRTCVRENVTDMRDAQRVLNREIHRYNYRQVHSTTQEVPYFSFQRALEEKRSLFGEFRIRPPYQSVKDIFCLRIERAIDSNRRISVNNLQMRGNNDTPGERIFLDYGHLFDTRQCQAYKNT